MRRKQTIEQTIPEQTIEPPPGPEEKVGFQAAIWRERARQKATEREAERRAREAESAAAAASDKVAVGAPAAPLSPGVDDGAGSTTTTLAAADSTRTPAVAPKRSSARKAPRTLASIAGTPGLGTVKTAKTVERFGAFQSSPYAPSKSAAKEIASLARNLRF